MNKDIGITFISIYLAVIGALAFIFSFVSLLYMKNLVPLPVVAFSLPLIIVLMAYGLAEIASAYMLEKRMFAGWFMAIVLLSIQGLVSAFMFAMIPTLLAVVMLAYLVTKKNTFEAGAPIKVETTEAPKVPEMKFVIFDPEEKKFVKRKR
jgi:hypothetical protein